MVMTHTYIKLYIDIIQIDFNRITADTLYKIIFSL